MLTEETREQRTNASYVLKIARPTTLKQAAVQSTELPEDKKFVVLEVPQEFPVLAYKYENQH